MTDKEAYLTAIAFPSAYAKLRLGLNLHPKQAEVLDALFDKPKSKVIMKCGNEVGKTRFVCVVAILYAIEILKANAVSTSATYRQVVKQLVPYLREHSSKFPNWEFLDNQIKINGESRYIGYSTSEDSKWQGWHETELHPLLIIADESAGIKDDIFQSIARCNPTYLLITGSPLGPEGFFYSACTNINTMKPFKHFTLSKYDCTKDKGYWLDKNDIDDFVSMWGRNHPLVLSSVFAEFATDVENSIITLSDIKRNLSTTQPHTNVGGRHVALDFAVGGAENVIAFRNGNHVSIIKAWKEVDAMWACRTIVDELNKLKQEYGLQANEVSGDADGLGNPMISRIKELGWNINSFHGGATDTLKDCESYTNKITECWIDGAKKIRGGVINIIDNVYTQDLILQLTSRKQEITSKGKLKLESKEDMKARGIPSPDRADAVLMAISEPASGALTSVYRPTRNEREYNIFA